MLSNVKRPRPTALFPSFVAQAGQVALAPNPALPKDQPLRGRWRKVDAVFTPNSHQSCQSLLGSWFNADVFLLQIRINHSNCYAVDGSMQMLFLLPTHINHANRYAVVGSMQMLFLLPTRINHANRYAVVGSMQMVFYSKLVSIMPIAARQLVQ